MMVRLYMMKINSYLPDMWALITYFIYQAKMFLLIFYQQQNLKQIARTFFRRIGKY